MKMILKSLLIVLFLFSEAYAGTFYRAIGVEPDRLDLSYRADNPIQGFWISPELQVALGFGNSVDLLPRYGVVLKLEIPDSVVEQTDNGYFCLPYRRVKKLSDYTKMIGIFKKSTLTYTSDLKVVRWFTLEEFRESYPDAKL